MGCPLLVKSLGWQSIFWVSSLLSLCWLAFFALLASSTPEVKPTIGQISSAELEHIQAVRESSSQGSVSPLPWKRLLTTLPFIANVATHCCYNYCGYLAISWVPAYFKDK